MCRTTGLLPALCFGAQIAARPLLACQYCSLPPVCSGRTGCHAGYVRNKCNLPAHAVRSGSTSAGGDAPAVLSVGNRNQHQAELMLFTDVYALGKSGLGIRRDSCGMSSRGLLQALAEELDSAARLSDQGGFGEIVPVPSRRFRGPVLAPRRRAAPFSCFSVCFESPGAIHNQRQPRSFAPCCPQLLHTAIVQIGAIMR